MGQFSVLHYWRSHSHFKVVVVGLVLSIIVQCRPTEALRMCYYCNTTTSGLDCVHNPSNVTDGETFCKGYCTILRKDYAYMREDSSLIFLQRSCELNPPVLDGVVVESYFKIFYRSCKSYLCNVGSGINSLRDMPVDPAWDQYTDEDFDTGKGSPCNQLPPPRSLFFLSIFFTIFIASIISA